MQWRRYCLIREVPTIDRSARNNPEEAVFFTELAEARAALPDRQRAAWLLTQIEGLTTAEAAVAL